MKVLMINKFFYIKGGSETYYFALKELLEKKGHEVIDFSMKDDKNFKSKYSEFFIDNIDYNKKQTIFSKIKQGLKIIYSYEAKSKLEKLIKETKPDIAHLHIFQHQLSSSIVDVLKKHNIPIVYTAHDLKMICPNYKMLCDGNVCEDCKGQRYYNCTKKKCLKKSKIKSLIATIEAYFNKYRKTYQKIDKIITPSAFYREKFIEFGVDKNKIVHIPNFLFEKETNMQETDNSDYFLYFGRLSEEKGIFTLVKAVQDTNALLKVVGTGPLKEQIENYLKDNKLSNVRVVGFKEGKELEQLIIKAKAVILPSEWYENGPYSAIEALKYGKVIVGSNMGGIPELIEEGVNGYIYENKKIEQLSKIITHINSLSSIEVKKMQTESIRIFKEKYTAQKHYEEISKIYNEINTNKLRSME